MWLAGCGENAKTGQDPRPALWEIVGPTGETEGWLFGTIHALPDDFAWRTGTLDAALDKADMLVVEVAGLGDTAELSRIFESMAHDRDDGPIRDRISPGNRAQFDALAGKAGLGDAYFDGMESWAAALALAQIAQSGNSGNGVDRALIGEFGSGEVVELEGARAQLAIFDALPPREQRDLLDAVLEETADYDDQISALAKTWQSGDTKGLGSLTSRGMLADQELRAVLLLGRNRAWAAQIENLLSANPKPFIAVGAAHLLGPKGLPALLVADGYAVKRIQ